jgi:hypothetical protein
MYVVKAGDSGNFSSTNFYYITGSSLPTISSPLVWYLSAATVYDLEDHQTDNMQDVIINGSIGVGSTSPERKLHVGEMVIGNNSDTNADIVSSDGIIIGSGKKLSLDQSYQTHAFIQFSNSVSNETRFIHQGYYGHTFTTRNNAPRMSILGNNGYIGINTITPTHLFQVNGGVGIGSNLISSGLNFGSDLSLVQHSNDFYAATIANGGGNGLGLNIRAGGIGSASVPLKVSRYDNTELIRVNGSGQMGIGTSVIPNGFKLAINGHAIAEKMIIRKNENWNWPDFVFEEDYKLPNLVDIKNFVKDNKHLPEIPSAKDIEENGQDLAEMNRLLLKKVEELTLYLLKEHELNNSQEDKIQALTLELNEVRKMLRP